MNKQMSCGQLKFRFASPENVKTILHEVRNRMPEYVKAKGAEAMASQELMEDFLLEVIRDVAKQVDPQIQVDRHIGAMVSQAPAYLM